jgi:hypothetical protein
MHFQGPSSYDVTWTLSSTGILAGTLRDAEDIDLLSAFEIPMEKILKVRRY